MERRELQRKRDPNSFIRFDSNLCLSTVFAQVCEETTQDQREKLRKEFSKLITKAYTGLEIVTM